MLYLKAVQVLPLARRARRLCEGAMRGASCMCNTESTIKRDSVHSQSLKYKRIVVSK